MPKPTPLHLDSLAHSYGSTPVFEAVNLTVNPGELVAVLGASGSGKSTLLRTVAGFVTPKSGTIRLGGVVVANQGKEKVRAEKRRVGMVFQDYALFEHMTVADNVSYGIHGDPDKHARVSELLNLVGLSGYENRYPASLSGGQQQRVALIRALAPRPSLIVLDEPFANLDGPLLREIGRELKHLLQNQGVSALLVTHERGEALGLADRVAILDGEAPAKLVQTDTPERVYAAPATAGAARLTGRVSLIDAIGQGTTADTALGSLALHHHREGACRVVIRPEQIKVTPGTHSTVLSRRFEGAHYELEINTPAGLLLALVSADQAPHPGKSVDVAVQGPCAAVN